MSQEGGSETQKRDWKDSRIPQRSTIVIYGSILF